MVASFNRRLIVICWDAIRFACTSGSTTLMEKQTSKINQLISRALFEFKNERHPVM
jgi:hypothetical protein